MMELRVSRPRVRSRYALIGAYRDVHNVCTSRAVWRINEVVIEVDGCKYSYDVLEVGISVACSHTASSVKTYCFG